MQRLGEDEGNEGNEIKMRIQTLVGQFEPRGLPRNRDDNQKLFSLFLISLIYVIFLNRSPLRKELSRADWLSASETA
jgi:hypothetical protein